MVDPLAGLDAGGRQVGRPPGPGRALVCRGGVDWLYYLPYAVVVSVTAGTRTGVDRAERPVSVEEVRAPDPIEVVHGIDQSHGSETGSSHHRRPRLRSPPRFSQAGR